MNWFLTELQAELEFMKRITKKVVKRKSKLIIKKGNIMPFDPTFEADMQAVAEKDAAIYPAGFSVTVEVPPTTPVTVTEKFVPGQPPAVI